MKAIDLDQEQSCPVCDGTGTEGTANCRRCEGAGVINRYGPNDPSSIHGGNHVILQEVVGKRGELVVVKMPIQSEEVGGFEGRFGDWQPSDLSTGEMADYQPDVKDRLGNKPLGSNTNAQGEYEMPQEEPYNGAVYDKAALHQSAWPEACPDCSGADLCIDHVITWCEARGDSPTAQVFRDIKTELGL